MSDGTVKLAIEFGDIEVKYEGPAAFAREDLVAIVESLVDKLAGVEVGFDLDAEDAEDDGDDEGGEAAPAQDGAAR